MNKGAFELVGKEWDFNLKPRDVPEAIPDDQREISHDVYEARNILLLFKERKVLKKKNEESLEDFLKRLLEAAEAGCTASNVKTRLAAEACDQIRKDIIRRIGMPIFWRYLFILAMWALGWAVLGFVFTRFTDPSIKNYGWIVVGAMVGAWISVAVRRWSLDFKDLPDLLNVSLEPFVRTMLVVLVALVFGLLLNLQVFKISIGDLVNLYDFYKEINVALLVGLIAGISERAISTQVVERIGRVVAPRRGGTVR